MKFPFLTQSKIKLKKNQRPNLCFNFMFMLQSIIQSEADSAYLTYF